MGNVVFLLPTIIIFTGFWWATKIRCPPYSTLLQKNQAGELTDIEQKQLAVLQKEVNKIMLQKARAAVLLRFRGQRLPTLTELRQLTTET